MDWENVLMGQPHAHEDKTTDGQESVQNFGLVCITHSDAIRYKTMTRKRLLSLTPDEQVRRLLEIYRHNLATLDRALHYCAANAIRLYRISSQIFPFADVPLGQELLSSLQPELHTVGTQATDLGIRMVIHPDQFVVLNSDSPDVVQNSITNLTMHAQTLDYLAQPRSPWAALEIHGGKGKRAAQLVAQIADLPEVIRLRLVLENDEYIYSAEEILAICQAAAVPMVFDAHHHVVYEKLTSYADPSIARYVREARTTWPVPEWQMVHISNGLESFTDRRHSDLIETLPDAYRHVRWIEVEAKHKELAIRRLQGIV
jgi:UV DNA damage endonuclease